MATTSFQPFLEALRQIGVVPRLLPNLEAHQDGASSAKRSKIACDNPAAIREIIERGVGQWELANDWFPYGNPLIPRVQGRFDDNWL